MKKERTVHKILIVSSSDKVYEFLKETLDPLEYNPLKLVKTAGEAKRLLLTDVFDIAIINTPLVDDFGIELALDMADTPMGIMLLTGNERFDQVCYRVEDSGILTLQKPNTKQNIYSAVKLLTAMNNRLTKMEKKNKTLQEKMADIRTVNRAKWLLMENHNMSESDAHYYIERQAMDSRMSRRQIAEDVIRTYDK